MTFDKQLWTPVESKSNRNCNHRIREINVNDTVIQNLFGRAPVLLSLRDGLFGALAAVW